mgnify:FL=1
MSLVAAELLNLLHTFMWPFIRVSAAFLVAPVFSMGSINLKTRILMGFIITMMIYPGLDIEPVDPYSFKGLGFAFNEVIVGALIGLSLQVVLAAIIVAGQAISGGMGLSMANMVDPNLGNVPTVSQFLLILGLMLFLALGGHLILITILADSFDAIQVGGGLLSDKALAGFLSWTSQIFIGGISLVLPVLFGLLMVNVCLGVVSRASPSLNIFAVGFPALIPIGLVMLILTIVALLERVEGLWFSAFKNLQEILLL